MAIQQRSKEWFAARLGRVTGSRIGPLMGIGNWLTREQAIQEMVTEVVTQQKAPFTETAATRYGTQNEPVALAAYVDEMFGVDVVDGGFHEHPDNIRFAASPDGLIGTDGGLEIKCPYKYRDGAPETWATCKDQGQYYAQVQWCMFVTGRRWWDFYQWAPTGVNHLERVYRDEEFIALAVEAASTALAYVDEVTSKPIEPEHPAKISHDAAAAKSVEDFKAAADEAYENSLYPDALARVEELTEELKAAKAELDEIIAKRAEQYGEKMWPDGLHRCVLKKTAGSVSYASIVKAHCPDVDLDEYRGAPSERWVVESVEPKKKRASKKASSD